MSKCTKCNTEKEQSEMSIHHIKNNKIYYRNKCIICQREYDKERNKSRVRKYNKEKSKKYYYDNKESCNAASRKWSIKNKERKKELNEKRNKPENKLKYSIAKKKWKDKNKNKELQYQINRYSKMTPLQKLKNNMRNSIRLYLKKNGFIKTSKTESILGCSFEKFKSYLESKFEAWMTWENWGKFNGELNYGWDIDHIIPLVTANSEEEVIKLNHYTNLQPLCSKNNRHIKRGKITKF